MEGELDKAEEAFREALTIAKQTVNGQGKVACVQQWLDHLQETRNNNGVGGCNTTEADKLQSAHSPEATANNPTSIKDRNKALTIATLLDTDVSSHEVAPTSIELSLAQPQVEKCSAGTKETSRKRKRK